MSKKQEPIIKCANDLKVNIKKSNGEVVIDEECCTAVSVLLKNSGELATSFFGAHNPEVVKILEKTLKMYFRAIKKALKENYKEAEEEIKVLDSDIPQKDKWNGEAVPDIKPKKTAKSRSKKQ